MLACGLDFGTSNSTLGVNLSGKPQMIKLESDHLAIPSAMFYEDEGQVYYGRAAIREFTDGMDGRLLRSIKSILGSDLMQQKTQLAGSRIAFTDILQGFIQYLKDKAEEQIHQPLEHIVMGRPVYFVDDNPTADKQAEETLSEIVKSAGFKHVEFQFEPIAAALTYEDSLQQEETALIVDIGGGTADFSIIRVGPNLKHKQDRSEDILANVGVHVGGTDFDRQLSLHSIMPHLGINSLMKSGVQFPTYPFFDLSTWHRIHGMYTHKYMIDLEKLVKSSAQPTLTSRLINIIEHKQGHKLLGEIEIAKINLTRSNEALLELDFIGTELKISTTLTEFENSISSELQKLEKTVREAVQLSGLALRDISAVFLTGGSTAIPAVRQAVLNMLDQVKVIEGDALSSVGYGLTLQAAKVL